MGDRAHARAPLKLRSFEHCRCGAVPLLIWTKNKQGYTAVFSVSLSGKVGHISWCIGNSQSPYASAISTPRIWFNLEIRLCKWFTVINHPLYDVVDFSF